MVATKDLPESIGDGMTVYPISRNDGKKGKSGLVCVMPMVSESVFNVFVNNEIGKAFIVDAVERLRSKIASKLYAGGLVIDDTRIGIEGLLALAKLETESQRMTKESIGVWFDVALMDLVKGAIAAKMPQGIAADKLAVLAEGYKAKFQTLAGREVSMPNAVRDQLLRVLALLPDGYEHPICEKVAVALAEVQEASETLAAL